MTKYADRAKMNTATTGTGTVTLSTAVSFFQTLANAGVVNGDTISYLIEDAGNAWELGWGVYSSAGPTLTRNLKSSSSGSLLNLSGAASVAVVAHAYEAQREEISRFGGWRS